MKLIKIASGIQLKLSKTEWKHIGFSSGWLKSAEDNIDLTRQVADTNDLYDAMRKMRNDIGSLQNNNDQTVLEATKASLAKTLEDLKNNNWVVRLDSEIGLNVESLETLLNNNNIVGFGEVLEKKFKKDLDESKAELTRQQTKQKGAQQGVSFGAEEAITE